MGGELSLYSRGPKSNIAVLNIKDVDFVTSCSQKKEQYRSDNIELAKIAINSLIRGIKENPLDIMAMHIKKLNVLNERLQDSLKQYKVANSISLF